MGPPRATADDPSPSEVTDRARFVGGAEPYLYMSQMEVDVEIFRKVVLPEECPANPHLPEEPRLAAWHERSREAVKVSKTLNLALAGCWLWRWSRRRNPRDRPSGK